MIVFRDLLQLHHVHGGQLCGHHHHGPQLPPQAGGDTRDAGVGEDHLLAVGTMASPHEQAGGENHPEDNSGQFSSPLLSAVSHSVIVPGSKENEGAG